MAFHLISRGLRTASPSPRFRSPYSLVLPGVVVFAVAFSGATVLGQSELTVETLIGSAVSGDTSQYAEVAEAIKRFRNRDVLAARTLLERAEQKHPQLPPVDLNMAKMYFVTGQTAAGRASLELTVRDQPNDPETYLILADQLYTQGRLIEAEALYDKAIPLIDSFEENAKRKRNFIIRSRAGRAAVSAVRQNLEAAIVDLREWVRVAPDDANAHHRLGRMLFLNKNNSEGYEELERAHEMDSSLPNPYVTAAQLYAQLGEQEKARQTFNRGVEQADNDVQTLLSYAEWLLQIGDVAKAEETMASAREISSDSLQVLIYSGVAAKMAGKRKPAEDYLLNALSRAPSNRGVLNQLALLLVEHMDGEKRKRALQFAQMNAKLYADSTETNLTLAWVAYRLGQNQLADQALKKGLQLGKRSPDSNYLVAKMLVDQNRTDDAQRLLEQSLEQSEGIFVYRSQAQQLLNSLQ